MQTPMTSNPLDTTAVREAFMFAVGQPEEFDAWLQDHDAAVLEAAAEGYTNVEGGSKARPHARTWLRERAKKIKEGTK